MSLSAATSLATAELAPFDERTAEVICTRCHGTRWALVKPASSPDPTYTCLRCRAVLAGRNVVDPLVTPEARERLARARQASPGQFRQRKEAPGISGASSGLPCTLRHEERLAERPGEPSRPVIEPYRYPTIPWDQERTRTLKEPDRVAVAEEPRGLPDDWGTIRAAVLKADRYRCRRCGDSKRLEAHHIRTRSEGGTDDLHNLMTLCHRCHDWVEPA